MSGNISHGLIVSNHNNLAAPTPCLSNTKESAAGPDQLREMTCAHENIGSGEHNVKETYMHVKIMGKKHYRNYISSLNYRSWRGAIVFHVEGVEFGLRPFLEMSFLTLRLSVCFWHSFLCVY